jgi:type II secretory pathway component GspD/PulD (secretin)
MEVYLMFIRRMVVLFIALLFAGLANADKVLPSVVFAGTNIQWTASMLAEMSGLDIVVKSDVVDTIYVHARLQNVTGRQALEVIAQSYALAVTEGPNNILILGNKYQNELNRPQGEMITEVYQLQYSRATDLQTDLSTMTSGQGSVQASEWSNSIIIHDYPWRVEQIKKAILETDRLLEQVTIESKLLQVDSDFTREAGIDWTVNFLDRNLNIGSAPSGNTQVGWIQGGRIFPKLSVDAIVKIAQDKAHGEVVAQPYITTRNMQQATIQLGERVPVPTGTDEFGNVRVELHDVGAIMNVTPWISENKEVTLTIDVERSFYEVVPDVGVVFTTQSANTSVTVYDGETLVIGGLTSYDTKTFRNGVPILMDIPILGYLFSYERKEVKKSDLIIFVTPHIVGIGNSPEARAANAVDTAPIKADTRVKDFDIGK